MPDRDLVRLDDRGSSPRDDLAPLAEQWRPKGRGRASFQQYDGTECFQWHFENNGWWPSGPVFTLLRARQPENAGEGGA